MFEKAREKYKDGEFKILVAKTIDKYEFCKTKNKITYTDFLNISEISIIEKILKEEKINNYIFFGGKENCDRSILIFYPEKFSMQMVEKNYEKILNVIRIELPHNIKYEHREFLSGIMKLGIKREKFGDIIVTETGADIISLAEISDYLVNGLKDLTRFQKSKITIENISELKNIEVEFENFGIIVSSIRLDNFVAELANCSRGKAEEIIEEGRVFINSINELKPAKKININDIITIRGKGKFIFDGIEKETRSGRYLLNIRKYK
jgi:RNA-binding protein YlmH